MNIFEQYGLKEVANVTFYEVGSNKPVLFLDSLKVSTIEQTAESTDAKGGWGNPSLITWDYNKEVNVTLEDALFSTMSLKTMMGAGIKVASSSAKQEIDINEAIALDSTGKGKLTYPIKDDAEVFYLDTEKGEYKSIEPSSQEITIEGMKNQEVRVFYKAEVDGTNGNAVEITIGASNFGGTYRIVGDTTVRNINGVDEPFQFVMEKAKITSEVTFTMEAEGDPATFNLPLKVLKDSKGNMFKLIKYSLPTQSA